MARKYYGSQKKNNTDNRPTKHARNKDKIKKGKLMGRERKNKEKEKWAHSSQDMNQ